MPTTPIHCPGHTPKTHTFRSSLAVLVIEAIVLGLLLLAAGASTASAASCGGNGQKACNPLKKGPICEPGLGKIDGKRCAPCGRLNQKACPAAEQGKVCRKGLTRKNGYCRAKAKPSCGGNGQKACNPLKNGTICEPGLGKVDGDKCAPCGRAGQVACPAVERGRRCVEGVREVKNRCVACGGNGERACPVAMKGTVCKPGLGRFDKVCKPCGKPGQKACPAQERGRQCAQWSTSVGGTCKPCGSEGARACRSTDKGRSCKKGLSRSKNKCTKKLTFKEMYEKNRRKFDRQHEGMVRDLASVKGMGSGDGPVENPGSGGINVEGWVFQAATDEDKRALMVRRLERSGTDVVTLMTGGGGAVVGGYTRATGFAMMRDYSTPEDGSDYSCRRVRANVFTAGLAGGGGLFAELGDWSGDFDKLHGWSNGWQVSASVLAAGWGKGAHWSADDGGSDGVTVLGGAGLGLDVGGEYARSHTKVGEEVACGSIVW